MPDEPSRGGDPPYGPYRLEVPPLSPNGHDKRPRISRARRALSGIPAGFVVAVVLATSIIPRLALLNLAFFEPWRRPVFCCVAGGLTAGALRRGRAATIPAGGAVAALLALWLTYGIVRLQNPVLWTGRNAAKVIVSDLLRLAVYAIPAGAAGALAGRGLRRLVAIVRTKRAKPITRLRGV
jgi:hypothetical protein